MATTQQKEKNDIIPGFYTCKEPIRVIKKLSYSNKTNSNGSIARTYGTWTKPDNFYYFNPGEKTVLTEEDLKNDSIRGLILNGRIYRTL